MRNNFIITEDYNQSNSMSYIDTTTKAITVISALLYSSAGIFNINILNWIFGEEDGVIKIVIYSIIAFSSLFTIIRNLLKAFTD